MIVFFTDVLQGGSPVFLAFPSNQVSHEACIRYLFQLCHLSVTALHLCSCPENTRSRGTLASVLCIQIQGFFLLASAVLGKVQCGSLALKHNCLTAAVTPACGSKGIFLKGTEYTEDFFRDGGDLFLALREN